MTDLPEAVRLAAWRLFEEANNFNALTIQTYYSRRPSDEIAAFVWHQAFGDGFEAGYQRGLEDGGA